MSLITVNLFQTTTLKFFMNTTHAMSKKIGIVSYRAEENEMSLIYVNLFKSPRLKFLINTMNSMS